MHFSQSGCVGVVKNGNRALETCEQRFGDRKLAPTIVQICCVVQLTIGYDRRKCTADGVGRFTLSGKFDDRIDNRRRSRGLGCRNAYPFTDQLARVQVNPCSLDAGSANINTKGCGQTLPSSRSVLQGQSTLLDRWKFASQCFHEGDQILLVLVG